MLADPATLKIQVILDWEFTHAMPTQFSYDPPWWLLLKGPDMWLEDYSMAEFVARYELKLHRFLRAMERIEARSPQTEIKLSMKMRDSWESGQFWFDYGIRKSSLHKKEIHQQEFIFMGIFLNTIRPCSSISLSAMQF